METMSSWFESYIEFCNSLSGTLGICVVTTLLVCMMAAGFREHRVEELEKENVRVARIFKWLEERVAKLEERDKCAMKD